MKTYILLGLSLLLFGSSANAQVNDPTYSVQNYKNPAKAKIAREEGIDKQITLQYAEAGNTPVANYKQQAGKQSQPVSGAFIPTQNEEASLNALENSRNYKTHQR